jgi:hypothetical protein
MSGRGAALVTGAGRRIGRALAKRGLSPHRQPLPASYKPTPGEWIGVVTLPLPPLRKGRESHPNAAVISTDVARIFDFAMLLSAAHPDEVLVGWRCFSGFEPCTKVIWAGKPRWKHGADPDHEVGFAVPEGQPAEVRPPSEPRVPTDGDVVSALLMPFVKPLKDPLKSGGCCWLSQQSMLAGR